MRRLPLRHFVVALGVITLVTCLAPAGSAQSAAPRAGQMTWAVHFTLAPRWLDPAETEGSITPFLTLYAVHDALLKPMPSGPSAPSLAESWTVSPNGLVYEFVLRANARFHNGERVTAEDVKFSFERYHGANATALKEHVREVRVIDSRRVQFHLKEPWPDFIVFYGTTATSSGWVVPKKYVEQVGDEGFKKAPIGAGPYKVVSFTPGVELQLEAFDGYWRKAPSVKRLVFRSLPDETTRAAALKRGDVDIAYFLNGPVAEEVRRTSGLRLMAVRSNTVFFLDFRGQWDPGSPWHDQRVRTAASLAIDRRAMNDAEQLGFAGLTGNMVPRTLEFALPIDPDPYDPARAKRLLAEAGFPRGLDAGDFTIAPPYEGTGEAIANYLAAVGIRVKIHTMERAAFYDQMRPGPNRLKGLILMFSGAPGDAASRIRESAVTGGTFSGLAVPEIDAWMKTYDTSTDVQERKRLVEQVQRFTLEQYLMVPVCRNVAIWGFGPRLANARIEDVCGAVPQYNFLGPYEDIQIKD